MTRSAMAGVVLAGVILAGGVLPGPDPAVAGPAGETLFVDGVFRRVAPGTEILYDHRRSGSGTGDHLPAIDDGLVRVTVRTDAAGAREAVVAFSAAGKTRTRQPFPASAGNPVLLTFLEYSLRAMASITGGSRFYIKNRIMEAFRSGGSVEPVTVTYKGKPVPALALVFTPFTADANRDRMGDFADLELRFIHADTVPGSFVRYAATTPVHPSGGVLFRERFDMRGVDTGD